MTKSNVSEQLKKGHRKYMSASPIENRISASLHFNINYIQHVATYNCMKCFLLLALKHSRRSGLIKKPHRHEAPKCIKNTSSTLHLLRRMGLASRYLNVRTGKSIYCILSMSPTVTEFPKRLI